jgi:ATP:ADP antiporter, AAA family
VYRLGDQVGAWSYTAIGALGFGISGLAAAMVPVSVGWVLLGLWLGTRHARRVVCPIWWQGRQRCVSSRVGALCKT